MDNAVRGQNDQAVILHTHQHHEHKVRGRFGITHFAGFPTLVQVAQGCLIAMMTIGNIELTLRKEILDKIDQAGLGDR